MGSFEPVVITDAHRPDVFVVLRERELEWHQGDRLDGSAPAPRLAYRYPYARIELLRVNVEVLGAAPQLVARLRSRSLSLNLRREDVARAQRALDGVDRQLAPAQERSLVRPAILRAAMGVFAVPLMAAAGLTGLCPFIVAAAFAPRANVLAPLAGGAAGVVLLWLALDHPNLPWTIIVLAVAVLAAVFARDALRSRPRPSTVGRVLLAIVGGCWLGSWAVLAAPSLGLGALGGLASSAPLAGALPLALAGGLLVEKRRALRIAALFVAACFFAGPFAATVARRVPLSNPHEWRPELATADAGAVLEVALPIDLGGVPLDVRVSPRAEAFAVEVAGTPTMWLAGRFDGGEPVRLEADALAFADERTVVLWRAVARRLEAFELGADAPIWKTNVSVEPSWAHLSIDRAAAIWTLLGHEDGPDGRVLVALIGSLGGGASHTRQFGPSEHWRVVGSASGALHHIHQRLDRAPMWHRFVLGAPQIHWPGNELQVQDGRDWTPVLSTVYALNCADPPLDATHVACMATSAGQSMLWTVDLSGHSATPVGAIDEPLSFLASGRGIVGAIGTDAIVLVDPQSRHATRIEVPCPMPIALAAGTPHLVAVQGCKGNTTIARYRVPLAR